MVSDLLDGVRAGKPRAIARMISQVENDAAAAQTAVTALYAYTGQAHIVGVTGSPGSGKSTLVNELAKAFRTRDLSVGIIAVDPSSPFTGGAILGDRVRMRDLSGDKGIFIRSLATRGSLGGLSRATAAALKVLDAAGFDLILVETVGAGQAEVDIANAAHTTLVIEAPGMGDDIQSIKAGILEIADILVVNKADRPGASRTVKSLEMMLHLGPAGGMREQAAYQTMAHHGRLESVMMPADGNDPTDNGGWEVPVLETVATEGAGIEALAEQVMVHRQNLKETGLWLNREKDRSRYEMQLMLQDKFMARLATAVPAANREALITAVARRETDPYTAVDELMSQLERSF